MKRKAIQLAKQTIVVSLPAKWVRRQGIKKGDEIDVEERGKELVINSKEEKAEKKIEIDISNLSNKTIGWYLASLYKMGYDVITIRYDSLSAIKRIEDVIKNLFIGFVIAEQNEKECVIRTVSQDISNEFNMALRKAFLVTISMGESCLEMIKQQKLKELNELLTLEKTNTQLTIFCERILSKHGYEDPSKTCFFYAISRNLETVCDEYKYICQYLASQKKSKIKINQDVLNLFERINNFVKSYYELFYKFNLERLSLLSEEEKKLSNDAEKLYKVGTERESVIVGYLLHILKKTAEFSTSMISARL